MFKIGNGKTKDSGSRHSLNLISSYILSDAMWSRNFSRTRYIGHVCLPEEQSCRSPICKEHHRWSITFIAATDLWVTWSGTGLGSIHKLQESPLTAASNWTPLMCKQHTRLLQNNNAVVGDSVDCDGRGACSRWRWSLYYWLLWSWWQWN